MLTRRAIDIITVDFIVIMSSSLGFPSKVIKSIQNIIILDALLEVLNSIHGWAHQDFPETFIGKIPAASVCHLMGVEYAGQVKYPTCGVNESISPYK